jgi:tryptophan synthase alpha chain
MTSAIEQAFQKAREADRCAFVPYVTGGFPDPDTCEQIILALDRNGADVIEVGIPFSDPLADGPTIQSASRSALDHGVTPSSVLDLVARVAGRLSCPVVAMTYVNPVLKMGFREFATRAKVAGISGVIIPDLPPEEADEWVDAARQTDLDTIFLVAPTTPSVRMETVAALSRGFLYYVSTTGVTGGACAVSEEMLAHIARARAASGVPVAVGFGIALPEQARTLAGKVDGIIVGSALIREIQQHGSPAEQVGAVSKLAASLSAALGRSSRNNGNGAGPNVNSEKHTAG